VKLLSSYRAGFGTVIPEPILGGRGAERAPDVRDEALALEGRDAEVAAIQRGLDGREHDVTAGGARRAGSGRRGA
jgi:hypothetical protein